MKKAIIYFILLIAGNILCLNFAFAQDDSRFFGLIGFIVGMFSIFQFSAKFSGLFVKRDFSFFDLTSDKVFKGKSINKPASIAFTMFILLLGLHVWGYIQFFKYQDQMLYRNGIMTNVIVIDKKWESRGKHSPSKYYIYYEYKYCGMTFRHNCEDDKKEIGDTITVKFLPDNPDNHIVIQNKIER